MRVLSCPVCGNPPVLAQVHDEFVVNCTHCDFELRLEDLFDEDKDFFRVSMSLPDAIHRWNSSIQHYLQEAEVA